jgi:ubiquinone/menaquinone biosynthesis C-methylase UbiE
MKTSEDRRRLLLPEMEGLSARWYARQRGTPNQLALFRAQATELTEGVAPGAAVLEVAPGPGYLAIEIARLGYRVTGLDISRTMVEIAGANAASAGVRIDFRHGDVSATPFADESFDLVVCQAAFKNFRHPLSALNEIWRLLRPAGHAVIEDMRKETTHDEIAAEVRGQGLTGINGFVTRTVLEGLRNRAYSVERFQQLVAESRFGSCEIKTAGIGLEVSLTKGR